MERVGRGSSRMKKRCDETEKIGFFGHLWDYSVAHVGLMIEFASGG